MGRVTARRRITTVDTSPEAGGTDAAARERVDTLVVEEPLELRLDGEPFTVTMRTPGHDVELAHGFCVSEGIATAAGDVVGARYCAGSVLVTDTGTPQNTYNVLDVSLTPPARLRAMGRQRVFATTSACGVCGSASIDSIRDIARFDVASDATSVAADVVAGLPDRLREEQRTFAKTGGLHAAGLFTAAGDPVCVREDVGRHNAVDKVVGRALQQGSLPLAGHVLVVSGRASFELVHKAAVAGIPVMVAVSAPSSLAVELAEACGVTLAAFVRGGRANLYTRPDRIRPRTA